MTANNKQHQNHQEYIVFGTILFISLTLSVPNVFLKILFPVLNMYI